ncbi:MAG: hypothetical protein JST70_13910 [Bacteroidetes bacterium]|nr:hypothetical protein [Bacteroidota bacterium]
MLDSIATLISMSAMTDGFYFDLPPDRSRDDFGFGMTTYTFAEFKNDVHTAIINHFGNDDVS